MTAASCASVPPRIKATTLESQLIHLIQELFGRTLSMEYQGHCCVCSVIQLAAALIRRHLKTAAGRSHRQSDRCVAFLSKCGRDAKPRVLRHVGSPACLLRRTLDDRRLALSLHRRRSRPNQALPSRAIQQADAEGDRIGARRTGRLVHEALDRPIGPAWPDRALASRDGKRCWRHRSTAPVRAARLHYANGLRLRRDHRACHVASRACNGERNESNRRSSGRVSTNFTGLPSALAASAAGAVIVAVHIQTLRMAFTADGKVAVMEHHASAGWPTRSWHRASWRKG
jgi:hypothetical protein